MRQYSAKVKEMEDQIKVLMKVKKRVSISEDTTDQVCSQPFYS